MNLKKRLGLALAAVSFVLILFLPTSSDLSGEGVRCLAVFCAVFFLYLFESINAAVVSLLIVPALTLLHIVDIQTALSGFASTSTYLIVGSFILAAAVLKSGLGTRITYLILMKIGTSARRVTFGILLVNIVTAFMIPSSTARTAMMLPICISLIRQFSSEKHSRFGANLMLTLCITNSTISAGILTATISNPMAAEYILSSTGSSVSFTDWFIWGFPPALIMTLISWVVIQLLFPPEQAGINGGKAFIENQLRSLGPMGHDEKITVAVLAFTIFLWVCGHIFGIDSTSACLLGACLLVLPKIGILKWSDCKNNISISVVFIVSGGVSLGAAMSSTGASAWIASRIFSMLRLQSMSPFLLIVTLIIIVQFMHIFFAGTATMANVFFPILIGIAATAGIPADQLLIPAAFMIGGYPILMFFNTTPSIMCYDTGEVSAGDFPKIGFAISVIACAVYALCAFVYWPLTGLL